MDGTSWGWTSTCATGYREHIPPFQPCGGRDLCGFLGVLDNAAVDSFPLLGQLGTAVALAPRLSPCSGWQFPTPAVTTGAVGAHWHCGALGTTGTAAWREPLPRGVVLT